MTLHEISKIAKEGDSYRRKAWTDPHLIFKWSFISLGSVSLSDAIADDWEIVERKVKKTGWVALFKNPDGIWAHSIHPFKEHAEQMKQYAPNRFLSACKIEWEEEE